MPVLFGLPDVDFSKNSAFAIYSPYVFLSFVIAQTINKEVTSLAIPGMSLRNVIRNNYSFFIVVCKLLLNASG